MEDQIMEYMSSRWVIGLVAVSVAVAGAAVLVEWVFGTFFEVLDTDEEREDR